MAQQLNPFLFLGVSIETTSSELKKKYYELSLLCHPDRGGKKDDMIVLTNCYNYVKEQLENKKFGDISESYINLEEEFKKFCLQQSSEIPSFGQIQDETNDFIKKFNQQFEESIYIEKKNDPFLKGYGYLMEKNNKIDPNNIIEPLNYPINNDVDNPLENILNQEIIIYQDPKCYERNLVQYHDLNTSEIKDFSHNYNNLQMSDYKIAHSKINITNNDYINLGISKEKFEELTNDKNSLENLIDKRELDRQSFQRLQFDQKTLMEQSKKIISQKNNQSIFYLD